jgi:SAM-dependent methyltransferase
MREINEVHSAHPRLEERYFQRMAGSMGDKIKLFEFLPAFTEGAPAPRILDIGAGGGEFANKLSELGYDVTAIDASDDAVMRIREKFPHITTATLLANHVDSLGDETFDVVICSSILHEVFSYGDDYRSKGHYSSLNRAFKAFHKVLKTDGTFLIRDGVLPTNWEDEGTIELQEGHEVSSVFKYLEMCPFANGGVHTNLGHLVNLEQVGEKTFKGNVRSLLEFSYTYTWGLDSYPRETQELYAVKTLEEYVELLEEEGFTVVHTESYLQPGYPKHLANTIRLRVGDKTDEWFDSNAIWVAIKK